jgi:excisionase family DNA binding protein
MDDLEWDRALVRVAEAARFLALSRSKLYQLMEAGALAYVKLGRSRRIPRSELTRLIQQNMVAARDQ